jgi:hypothetical protein
MQIHIQQPDPAAILAQQEGKVAAYDMQGFPFSSFRPFLLGSS